MVRRPQARVWLCCLRLCAAVGFGAAVVGPDALPSAGPALARSVIDPAPSAPMGGPETGASEPAAAPTEAGADAGPWAVERGLAAGSTRASMDFLVRLGPASGIAATGGAIGVPGTVGLADGPGPWNVPGALGGAERAGERRHITERLTALGAERARPVESMLSLLAGRGLVANWDVFPAFGVIAVHGCSEAADAVASAPGVIEVRVVRQYRLAPARLSTAPSRAASHLRETRADLAWSAFGAMGEGTTVAVIDTGAEWLHPLLRTSYRGRDGRHDHDWVDFVDTPGRQAPVDLNGHGTAVLGLVAGNDGGLATGVSPAVQWIAARAFDALK